MSINCPNCTSEDLKAYELDTAATADGRTVIGCAYCIEDGRIVRGENGTAELEGTEQCPHEAHMGECIGCGEEMPPEDHYVGADETRQTNDELSTGDLNVINELVSVATGALDRLARDNPLDAQAHLGNAAKFREFNDRMQRR